MTGPYQQPLALIVGIGASARGLAAFKTLLANIPVDSGMAFVLVQHLDPQHKSLLVELLAPNSPIPVVAANDGLAVKQNCVFVIPPNATLTIKDGVLQLATPAPAREHRWPIDTFLTSWPRILVSAPLASCLRVWVVMERLRWQLVEHHIAPARSQRARFHPRLRKTRLASLVLRTPPLCRYSPAWPTAECAWRAGACVVRRSCAALPRSSS
jgi:CheB methylesterase